MTNEQRARTWLHANWPPHQVWSGDVAASLTALLVDVRADERLGRPIEVAQVTGRHVPSDCTRAAYVDGSSANPCECSACVRELLERRRRDAGASTLHHACEHQEITT